MTALAPLYEPAGYDEAIAADGRARPAYEQVLSELAGADLATLAARVDRATRERGLDFRGPDGTGAVHVDACPRLVEASEWARLAAGLAQRARALNEFIADVYSERRIVAEGVVPARVIESADHYEPALAGAGLAESAAPVVGFDLVRGADGRLVVLEDNVRTPSGLSYAIAVREALDETLALEPPGARLDPAASLDVLGAVLGQGQGPAVLLSDGPRNAAWYEHRELARRLELGIVTPDRLELDGGRLLARVDGGEVEVATVYRRTDEDRLVDDRGEPTWVGRLLGEPLRAGRLRVVNGFGAGVADDKLVHAYVERMINFYLGEEPRLESVHTYDLSLEGVRDEALARLDQLVVKPRAGLGGEGIVICAHAEPSDRERIAAEIRARPTEFIVQETIELSSHPTVCGARFEPRHVDLRAFVVGGELVAALTRVALDRGALIVNSSQNGGLKDTWALG